MKKSKFIGIISISLIWIFSLILIISLSTLLFFTIENKYFMSNIKTDTVKIVDKKYHVLSRTMDGQNYEKSTEYWVTFSNQDINNIRISGINNYRPGTEIEISYRKSGLTNSIELIDINVNADSDNNTNDDVYVEPFWEDVKSIEVEKVN